MLARLFCLGHHRPNPPIASTCATEKIVSASFRMTGPRQQPWQDGSPKRGPSTGHGGVVVGHMPGSRWPETYVEKSRIPHRAKLSAILEAKSSGGASVRLRHFHVSPATTDGIPMILRREAAGHARHRVGGARERVELMGM